MRTEREKMLTGELYDPLDAELVAARERARDLCQTLNATREAEQEERRFGKPVDIGSDVWLGGAVVILPGARVGSGSVIGAGSVVTRNVPEGVFAAGNPCRVIREIAE